MLCGAAPALVDQVYSCSLSMGGLIQMANSGIAPERIERYAFDDCVPSLSMHKLKMRYAASPKS